MSADLVALLAHLEDETSPFLAALASLDDAGFRRATPAAGWSVLDQVTHLAYFDEAATTAILDPEGFGAYRAAAASLGERYCDDLVRRSRDLAPPDACGWLRRARDGLSAAARSAGPSARAPWFGPSMSVASMVSARIMETWAHGQDVYDALGLEHPTTGALYDVARLCARTRANSYAARGLVAPDGEIALELTSPTGERWHFGEGGGGAIRGDAVEFCLVATQRRHLEDTGLVADGDAASEWLRLAQAYAGPPGAGRAPLGASR